MGKLDWEANEMRWCKRQQKEAGSVAHKIIETINEELTFAEIKEMYEQGYYLEKIDESKVNAFGECFFDDWIQLSLDDVEEIIKGYTKLKELLRKEMLTEEEFNYVDNHPLLEGIKKMGDSRQYPGYNWYSVILKDETDWDVYYKYNI